MKLQAQFAQATIDMKRRGMVCASCELSDRLFSDSHGTFCQRCGPSYPLKQGAPAGRAALKETTDHE